MVLNRRAFVRVLAASAVLTASGRRLRWRLQTLWAKTAAAFPGKTVPLRRPDGPAPWAG